MPDQKDFLLQKIGMMEGQVVDASLARIARGLAGVPSSNPMIHLMLGQLAILMLRDHGGDRKYTVESIDDETSGLMMKMEETRYKGKQAIRFFLEKK